MAQNAEFIAGISYESKQWNNLNELSNDFNQLCYYFDCRNELVIDDIVKSLKEMIKQNEEEKKVIKSTLCGIKQGENAFLFLQN